MWADFKCEAAFCNVVKNESADVKKPAQGGLLGIGRKPITAARRGAQSR